MNTPSTFIGSSREAEADTSPVNRPCSAVKQESPKCSPLGEGEELKNFDEEFEVILMESDSKRDSPKKVIHVGRKPANIWSKRSNWNNPRQDKKIDGDCTDDFESQRHSGLMTAEQMLEDLYVD